MILKKNIPNSGGRSKAKMSESARLCWCLSSLIVLLQIGGCSSRETQDTPLALPCKNNDRNCAFEEREKDPLHTIDVWQARLAKPLVERVALADKQLVRYIALDNVASGYAEVPRLPGRHDMLLAELRQVVMELPEVVKAKVDKTLAGICLVENFGGTGMSQYIYGKDGQPVAGYIALDPQVLNMRTANSWATWKENSPFKADASIKLTATIENATGDTRKNAIRYILLHEIGHILSIGEKIHPLWTEKTVSARALATFPFASISWRPLETRGPQASKFDDTFPERKNAVYYVGARLEGSAAESVYAKLARTNFPTLYAATNWGDDFAESFANYVHVVIDKRPFEIRIERNGVLMTAYKGCWEEARCREKKQVLEEFLRR